MDALKSLFITFLMILTMAVCIIVPGFIIWYSWTHFFSTPPTQAKPLTKDDWDGW